MLAKVSRIILRFSCISFILALPIGYYYDGGDTATYFVAVHGGHGQVASIIRGCNNEVLNKTKSTFSEFEISGYSTFPPGKKTPILIGLKSGYLNSNANFADFPYTRRLGLYYINPSINFEWPWVGAGIGPILGNMPIHFRDIPAEKSGSYDKIPLSCHVRLGYINLFYAQAEFGENSPLASNGYCNLGVGYKIGKMHMFSGLSTGFYDNAGFVHKVRIELCPSADFGLAFRYGTSEDIFERAISGGLIYKFGK